MFKTQRTLPRSRFILLKRFAIVAFLGIGSSASAATIIVTNTNDSGEGSLRDAIDTAATNDIIAFDPSITNQTITLLTPLDPFDQNLTIDTTAAPGLKITGSDLLVSGPSQLTLAGSASFIGDANVNDGELILFGTIVGDTTVESSGVLTLNGVLRGDVVVEPGGVLDGNIIVRGDTSYLINGNVTGNTMVQANGALNGLGLLSGDVTSRGAIDAGDGPTAIGKLNFGSELTINGGTLQVDMNSIGNMAGVSHDLYEVDGDVTLSGGIVNVRAVPGAYTDASSYTFLTSGGIRTGIFDGIVDDMPFFDAVLGYNDTSVFFTLEAVDNAFTKIGQTCNQLSVGAYLDSQRDGAAGDLADVFNALTLSSAESIQKNLDQLGGQIYPSLVTAQFQHTSFVLAMLRDQLVLDIYARQANEQPTEQTRGWVRGYGIGGDVDQDDCGTYGFDYRLGGTEIALQRGFHSGFEVGLFANLATSEISTNGLAQEADVDSYQLGGSLQYTGDRAYSLGIGGGGYQQYDTRRGITIASGMIDRVATSQFDGSQAFGYLEHGLLLQMAGMYWVPHISMQYVAIGQDSVQESGADSVNLTGESIDADSLRTVLGMSLQKTGPTSLGPATTKLRAGWMHEYFDRQQNFTASFSGLDETMAVQGINLGSDWAVLGANLQWSVFRNATALLAYQGQVNEVQSLHSGAAGLEVRW